MSVFPLFVQSSGEVDYVLSDEAIREGTVSVEEISESGAVGHVSIENGGDTRILFLEGEELVGAKQNRILNTSLLIAAHSKTRIPVSCVEQGRWHHTSRAFRSGGTSSPSKLRRFLKESVTVSLGEDRGHTSDQSRIWKEVDRQQAALETGSGTSAMSDTFAAYKKRMDEFRQKIRYVEGACGTAVAIGATVLTCDLFEKPSTCIKVWDRLLSGFVLDALEAEGEEAQRAEIADVERLMAVLGELPWKSVEVVGEGEECRATSERGDCASLLSLDGVLVHGSLVSG